MLFDGDQVVQGDLVGIATRDIKANTLGALCAWHPNRRGSLAPDLIREEPGE